MTTATAPPRTELTLDERRALKIRQNAAMQIVDFCDETERWDLLVAVVWPSDPLLGLKPPRS